MVYRIQPRPQWWCRRQTSTTMSLVNINANTRHIESIGHFFHIYLILPTFAYFSLSRMWYTFECIQTGFWIKLGSSKNFRCYPPIHYSLSSDRMVASIRSINRVPFLQMKWIGISTHFSHDSQKKNHPNKFQSWSAEISNYEMLCRSSSSAKKGRVEDHLINPLTVHLVLLNFLYFLHFVFYIEVSSKHKHAHTIRGSYISKENCIRWPNAFQWNGIFFFSKNLFTIWCDCCSCICFTLGLVSISVQKSSWRLVGTLATSLVDIFSVRYVSN